jgi:hypothetical protein
MLKRSLGEEVRKRKETQKKSHPKRGEKKDEGQIES